MSVTVSTDLLAVEAVDGHQHTYIYEPGREFHQMTLEALPTEENYQPLDKVFAGPGARPTIEELVEGHRSHVITMNDEDKNEEQGVQGKVGN